jgi:hypothetical protein
MKLVDLIDNSKTDKNTIHAYLDTYEELFSPLKESATNILELGINQIGSLKLWNDYFTNANIYGVNIYDSPEYNLLNQYDRIKFKKSDPYNVNFIKSEFIDKDIKFDVLIDDGPHSLESVIFFVRNYSLLLNKNGVLIVEDIQNPDFIPIIKSSFPDEFQNEKLSVVDVRMKKFRYDDMLIVCKND